ncbi:MAG: hypothetical protein EB060_10020 [Proteobacteria bacterium]|nr:hypothetical protein [Pseudomonadota bacterium]
MSHAKNWVDYGFIGINPSGERVEGYSAPLQFFVYALLYAISGIDYHTFAALQTFLGTFFLGVICVGFLAREHLYKKLLGAAFSAIMLIGSMQFLLWHGSGMENPFTNVFFALTLLLLFKSLEGGRIVWWHSAIVFCASISRIESIYYIFPLLVLYNLFSLHRYRSLRSCLFTLLVIAMWVLFNWWRYMYFGSFTPNTAPAKDIDVWWRIVNWRQSWMEMKQNYNNILIQNSVFVPVSLSFFLLLKQWNKKDRTNKQKQSALYFVSAATALMAFMACISTFFFGIDGILGSLRMSTQLAVFAAFASIMMLFYQQLMQPVLILAFAPLLLSAWIADTHSTFRTTWVGYPADNTDPNYKKMIERAQQENLIRPTFATADIGSMSWRKGFNILDLAYLGSPFLAHTKHKDSINSTYFFDYMAPDFIENHGWWSCMHVNSLMRHPLFEKYYVQADSTSYMSYNCMQIMGIWVRRDILKDSTSRERALITDLQKNPTPGRLAREMQLCTAEKTPCEYVVRAAYRLLPEFRERKMTTELEKVFVNTPVEIFAGYLLEGYKDPLLYHDMIELLQPKMTNTLRTPEDFLKYRPLKKE